MFLARQQRCGQGGSGWPRLSGLLIAYAVASALALSAETPPRPSLRVPLKELGFPGYVVSLMHAGASMATVHMLDGSHALFTYSLRSLVPRLPGDDANDTDREVAAVLLEVPSGKVLARTKWHLHDHGQYLWSVGHGRFVLRMGNDLSLIAPMEAMEGAKEPFLRFALPHRPGQPVRIAGSPDGRIITVEIQSEIRQDGDEGDHEGRRKKHYTLEFFRIEQTPEARSAVRISGAGVVGSPVELHLPLDGDGYLWAEDGERGKWNISFNEFGGKQQPLAPVISSCHPRLNLLSRSQFVVESCHGLNQQPMLATFDFDGHENWEEQFGETLQPSTLALAPEAGRFAMSRLVASSTGGSTTSTLSGDDALVQEIRVYQTESGDLLLHLQCVPVARTAENFDLSPDGSMLVVLAPETLDFYRLPELSAKDRKELAEVQTMTPPEGSGPVALTRITRAVGTAPAASERTHTTEALAASPAASGGTPDSVPSSPQDPGAANASAPRTASMPEAAPGNASAVAERERGGGAVAGGSGEPAANGPRRPPTLLKPGESAEYKGQSPSPK